MHSMNVHVTKNIFIIWARVQSLSYAHEVRRAKGHWMMDRLIMTKLQRKYDRSPNLGVQPRKDRA